MYKFDIVKDSTELRKAIAENPDLPIVVMASYEAVSDEFYWTYCSAVRCEAGEVLDCECPWKEGVVYSDRIQFPLVSSYERNEHYEKKILPCIWLQSEYVSDGEALPDIEDLRHGNAQRIRAAL